jgi:microcystin-dependent protein
MGSPYVGEIRMFGGNFAPAGWALCQGQQIPISENETLFNLIGTTYGGDGQQTFNLPNLQSRVPMHMGSNSLGTYTIGQTGGVETVTLTTQQMPAHNHLVLATNAGQQVKPTTATMPAVSAPGNNRNVYGPAGSAPVTMANLINPSGGNQPHSNIQPVLAINFIISLFGIYPTPN